MVAGTTFASGEALHTATLRLLAMVSTRYTHQSGLAGPTTTLRLFPTHAMETRLPIDPTALTILSFMWPSEASSPPATLSPTTRVQPRLRSASTFRPTPLSRSTETPPAAGAKIDGAHLHGSPAISPFDHRRDHIDDHTLSTFFLSVLTPFL
ncbi:hypothetical protein L2E82_39274 [Cichorium intybus]|uniref:Uncharacterized protein n=1 Tax=Cichorium intybus TaxID=13427 RepID=A0ACB9AI21_CICIN|nr:hypothetical protein L2E82_39274 [Cichorium intybus]